MADVDRQRILIVDDEEAILETMGFTFQDEYDVLTSSSAQRGLELLAERSPVAAVISDQRMPEMTGVEFLAEVFQRHPETTRIILTGFADMDAIIQSINNGHVYAYITKPWEPDELKQVVRRAVDRHRLALENERLVRDLAASNAFLEAVMDHLDTGAIAVDGDGVVQAANRPGRRYLRLATDPRGRALREVLREADLPELAETIESLCGDPEVCFEEFELSSAARALRIACVLRPSPWKASRAGAGVGWCWCGRSPMSPCAVVSTSYWRPCWCRPTICGPRSRRSSWSCGSSRPAWRSPTSSRRGWPSRASASRAP
jgi:FixJ family two-component response regulator